MLNKKQLFHYAVYKKHISHSFLEYSIMKLFEFESDFIENHIISLYCIQHIFENMIVAYSPMQ